MANRTLDQTLNTYAESWEHHRRSVSQAQRDACQSLIEAWTPAHPLDEQQWEQRFDRALLASMALLQVHADGHNSLQRVGEVWLCTWHALWLTPWQERDCPLKRVLEFSEVSSSSLSKASRQVSHFAVTRWSAAALCATQDARRAWRRA